MIRFQEEHHLCKMLAYVDGSSWLFVVDDWNRKTHVSLVNKTAGDIIKLFIRGKVKDNAKQPRSIRGVTYQQIVDGVISGADRVCWLWSNNLNLFYDAAKEMGAIISGGK